MYGVTEMSGTHVVFDHHPTRPRLTVCQDRELLVATEQTLSDREQALSDSEQTLSDADQAASDRDQAASDRDLAAGGDARAHALTRDIRRRNTHRRQQTTLARLDAASKRKEISRTRNVAAVAREPHFSR